MNPEKFKDLMRVREELENMCRNLIEKHKAFSSILYIVSIFNHKVEIHVEQIHDYLENAATKRSLIYITHKHCYSLLDKGHQVLGVGCILDVLLSEKKPIKGETMDEMENRIEEELKSTPLTADPTAIDSLYSILCTHEGSIIRQQRYYKHTTKVRIESMKEDEDSTTHKGLFTKLYPPPRTAKNSFDIMIIDVCLYDPQFTFPGPILIGHQLVINDLRRKIIKEKNAGVKIILVRFPDHSGRVMHFSKSLFDEIIVFKSDPKSREILLSQIDKHCHLKHNWNIKGAKIILAKPHQHL